MGLNLSVEDHVYYHIRMVSRTNSFLPCHTLTTQFTLMLNAVIIANLHCI